MTRLTVLLSLGCLVASPIDAQTVTVYGSTNGSVRVVRQNPINKSCAYDGTHY